MKRRPAARAAAALLASAVTGCAADRTMLPEHGVGSVALAGAPPLHATINGGLARPDTARADGPEPPPAALAGTPPVPSRALPGPVPTAEPPAAVAGEPPADPDVRASSLADEAEGPTLEPAEPPAPEPAEPSASEPSVDPTPAAPDDAPSDPEVGPASHVVPDDPLALLDQPGQPATQIAARVGDSVITLRELQKAVKERLQGQQQQNQGRTPGRDEINRVAKETLEYLIDRALIVQAARRELNKPKQWEMFRQYVTKKWTEEELPLLMKRSGVSDELALERSLAERGESLSDRRDGFMLDAMAREYAGMKLHTKIQEPGYNEVLAYYREHLRNYDQPAQVRWREIFVAVDGQTDRDAARAKAQTALERLARGDDFAAVAREVSRSPKARDGGLWETGFDSFGSAAVNRELKRLQPGQVSPILEDPQGYYIVRVESVRPAGPRPFPEVQRSIRAALLGEHYDRAMKRLLDDVYRTIPVTSPLFEGTETEPKQVRYRRESVARAP